jgi:hypothetical protein
MATLGEGNRVLFSTQRYQAAAIASTGTVVAKIVAAQFATVASQDVCYHVSMVAGAQSSGTFQVLQATSTAITDPTNAAVTDSVWLQTLAGQTWNYDLYFRVKPTDNLVVTMPNSSGATGVAVKLYAEPLI